MKKVIHIFPVTRNALDGCCIKRCIQIRVEVVNITGSSSGFYLKPGNQAGEIAAKYFFQEYDIDFIIRFNDADPGTVWGLKFVHLLLQGPSYPDHSQHPIIFCRATLGATAEKQHSVS